MNREELLCEQAWDLVHKLSDQIINLLIDNNYTPEIDRICKIRMKARFRRNRRIDKHRKLKGNY
jgi:hypothetical protein